MRHRLVSLGFAVSLGLSIPGVAHGQGKASAADVALAETLFRDGKALMQQGKHADACPKLEESQRLDPGGGTQLALALCYEGAGRVASAWAAFSEAVSSAKRDNRPERVKIAQDKVDALASKVPYLTVVVAPEVAAYAPEVRRDGTVLRPMVWGTPIPVDPGEHVVEVTAPGRKKWGRKVTVGGAEGLKITLKVGKLDAEGEGEGEPSKPGDPAPPAPGSSPGGEWKKPTGITLLVLGAAGIGVGSYFGLQALSKRKDADAICPERACASQQSVDLVEESKTSATLSTVGFGVGLAFAVGGVVFLVTSPSQSAAVTGRSPGTPLVGHGLRPAFHADSRGGAVALGGSF